jgi:hypothetical protein
MEWNLIKDQLKEIREFSTFIHDAITNSNVLFEYIDNIPLEVKKILYGRYISTIGGPVNEIRKKVVIQFVDGKVNRDEISKEFQSGKLNNPKAYTQYKNLYSILYPFLTYQTNEAIYQVLEDLSNQLCGDLMILDKTKIKCSGFDGSRNTGDDHAWFAIYNNTYPNQTTAKQLFFSIHNGAISYALFDRGQQLFVQQKTFDTDTDNYKTLLDFFNHHKNSILLDNFRAKILSKYPIGELINQIDSRKISSWLIKPGEKGKMWKQALKEENIRIGWGSVVSDIFSENNFSDEFVLKKLDQYDPKDAKQTNNRKSIISFLKDVKIGDVIYAVSGKYDIIGVGVVSSATILDEDELEFKAYHNVDWLIDLHKSPYNPSYDLPIKTVTELEARFSIPIIKSIFNFKSQGISKMNFPSKNTILYGPPGTGKTYELNKYKRALFTDTGITKKPEDILREKLSPYPFWKVLAGVLNESKVALGVGDLIQDPIVKAKLNPINKTNPQNIAWSELQSYADDQSTQLASKYRRSIKLFTKNNESKWSIAEDKKNDLLNIIGEELLEIVRNPVIESGESTETLRYNFITFHQKYGYEDFIEGIKPVLKDDGIEEQASDLQFELKKGIFYNSCLEALKLAGYDSFENCNEDSYENRIEKFNSIKNDPTKQFALFIDEINRANISAVLGELITLLEEDKRIGCKNEMWLNLPYSNKIFSVPSNLYLVGTMNTADRSIALLDIALRRRFEFKALYPIYEDGKWWKQLLFDLNTAIYNWKKNPDFFIGHAFFINAEETEKVKILNSKIIPLLYEYCQNNSQAILKILGEANIQVDTPDLHNNYQIVAK